MILHEVDKPGSDIDSYVNSLDNLLDKKLELINSIKPKIQIFKHHLKEEEHLSNQFYDAQQNNVNPIGNNAGMTQDNLFNPQARNFY